MIGARIAAGNTPAQKITEQSAAENREAMTTQLDKVKTETKEAAHAMKDYTYAQKTEFVEAMQAQSPVNRTQSGFGPTLGQSREIQRRH